MQFAIVLLAGLLLQATAASRVAGRVVNAATAEPVADARVVLTDGTSLRSTTADGDGRFVFPEVTTGSYRLTVAAEGYVRQDYARSRVLQIDPGESCSDLVVNLVRTGALSGRLREIDGRPAVGVPVQLWGMAYDQMGRKSLHLSYTVKTNDRGEYRFFWVTPGRYSLSGGPSNPQTIQQQAQSAGINANIFPDPLYALTYFPLTVDVLPDREASGIDFVLNPLGRFRIRGRVIDQSGGLLATSPVLAVYAASEPVSGSGTTSPQINTSRSISPDGTFEIADVPPGSYEVGLTLNIRVAAATHAWPVHVDLRNTDEDGVVLTAVRAAPVQGKLTLEGQPLSSLKNLEGINLSLVKVREGMPIVSGRTPSDTPQTPASDGSFSFEGVIPGDYRVEVSTPDSWNYYVKEIRYGQVNVLNETVHIAAIDPPASLSVVVSSQPGEISGTVLDEKEQPVSGIQAVLIPDRQRNLPELYQTTNADREGRFAFRVVPPGDYTVFAWETIEAFSYFDEGLIKQYETLGQSVHVEESSKPSITVKVIPASR